MRKTLILIFLTIVLCANLHAQKDKYLSKEENEYYKNFERNVKMLSFAYIYELEAMRENTVRTTIVTLLKTL
jgi:Na+-transporting NADH:ubiquinone oxidoreductase subunit NqrC